MDDLARDQIRLLLAKLGKGDRDAAIRRAALLALDEGGGLVRNGKIQPADVEALVAEVSTPRAERWRQSALAAWALGKIEIRPRERESAVDGLLGFAGRSQKDGRTTAAFRALLSAAGRSGVVVGAVGTLLTLCHSVITINSPAFGLSTTLGCALFTFTGILFVGLPFLPLISAWIGSSAAVPRHYAIGTLGAWNVWEAVGILAEEARRGGPLEREAVLNALESILRTATPQQYGSLAPPVQRSLSGLLFSANASPEFKLTLLDALGKAAGASALSDVRLVAHHTSDPRIAGAAQAILPVLEQRARAESDSGRLVRPSEDRVRDSEMLVRAALESTTDSTLLIRAAHEPPIES